MPKSSVTEITKASRPSKRIQKAAENVEAVQSYHHGDLRNALIAAGRAALDEMGARELSLRDVARTVGVSEAAPSRHFDGKEGLLAAIASQGFLELAAMRIAVVNSNAATEEKVRLMMHQYVQFARNNKGLFYLMVGPRILQPANHSELKESSGVSFNHFASTVCELALEKGWPKSLLNLVVHAAWSAEHGLATLLLGGRAPHADFMVDVEEMIAFTISIFISRITAGPQDQSKEAVRKSASRYAHPHS